MRFGKLMLLDILRNKKRDKRNEKRVKKIDTMSGEKLVCT